MKTILECHGKISLEQLRKVEKIKPLSHSKKKVPHFDHFPLPGEIDPYVLVVFSSKKLHLKSSVFHKP